MRHRTFFLWTSVDKQLWKKVDSITFGKLSNSCSIQLGGILICTRICSLNVIETIPSLSQAFDDVFHVVDQCPPAIFGPISSTASTEFWIQNFSLSVSTKAEFLFL